VDQREPDLRAMSYRKAMGGRPLWPLVLALLGGCFTQPAQDPGYTPGWGSGIGGGDGPGGFGCHTDSDCGSQVCARDGECLLASEVHIIHVTWTVNGAAASPATCAQSPDLELTFEADYSQSFGFAPVPCMAGKFTVDKMPTSYTTVMLGPEASLGDGPSTAFDAQGNATLDLR
jgi:hypothetical protein